MVLLVIACLGALVLGAPPANAKPADRVPVAAVLVGAEDLAVGACHGRMDGGPVVACDQIDWSLPFTSVQLWSLGMQGRQWWSGDAYLQGTALVDYSWVESVECGGSGCTTTGLLWGTTQWTPDAFSKGGWKGRFSFTITSFDNYGFSYSGPLVAEGYGELKGSRLVLTAATDGTVAPWEGSHTSAGYVLESMRG